MSGLGPGIGKGIGMKRKKNRTALLTALLAAVLLTGCGGSGEIHLKDLDVDKYVTLGEYVGMEVPVAAPAVDELQVKMTADSSYYERVRQTGAEVEDVITDRPVALGDTVNIDYVGKKDGTAFDGGTDAGAYLTIGLGQFIDGFEEGLIGVMPGETVDLNLTFPTNYNPELAGQAVVFTVTVNAIMPEGRDESILSALGIEGVTTREEFDQYVYDYLYGIQEANYDGPVRNGVMEVPKAMRERYAEVFRQNIEAQAENYGLDADEFTGYYYGMTVEEFLEAHVEEAVKQDIAFQAVANRENLNVSDEELDSILQGYARNAGAASVEEFLGEASREDYREYLMLERVEQFLMENVKIVN